MGILTAHRLRSRSPLRRLDIESAVAGASARGWRSAARRAPALRPPARTRGPARLLGYAVSGAAALIALVGVSVVAPTLTNPPPRATVAPTVARPEASTLPAQGSVAGEVAVASPPKDATVAPLVLSDADRGLLAALSGAWRSASGKIVVDGANLSIRATRGHDFKRNSLRIVQISHPFMIADDTVERYTILLRKDDFIVYSPTLFPPIEYRRD